MSHEQDRPRADLVQRNEDGSLTKETIKRAMKAFRKRLKLTRLDEESRLGHDAMSKGMKSTIFAIQAPERYPPEVWEELVERGRLRRVQHGLYEIVEVEQP
ncbi:MAG: hypothetical protein ACYTGW_21715 [Planctomycetota bacterium]|jgi:hypothetical protein